MNLWECEHPGCNSRATGTGGAIGLRAIGWYFHPAGPIFCPVHRPDGIPCTDERAPETSRAEACPLCAGEGESEHWQQIMNESYGVPKRRGTVYFPPRLAPLRAECFEDEVVERSHVACCRGWIETPQENKPDGPNRPD
jgi:hypothetical protein